MTPVGGGTLQPGRIARVRVPATSANLGPGFDHLGLALAWYDECEVEVLAEGVEIEVTGEGAGSVPRDRSHLLVQCLDRGLADLGHEAPGVRLRAHNTIPHSRGLGSSSAATVAGLAAAWALVHPDRHLDRLWLLRLASEIEGHGDNVAPAIYGGFAITYVCERGEVHSSRAQVHPELAVAAYVPERHVPTRSARAVLPDEVPRSDALANVGRAALLVHAMAYAPSQLREATADWLHQPYRAHLMPESAELMARLRRERHPAFISGAGPTVLVVQDRCYLDVPEVEGFTLHHLEIGHGVELF